MTSAYLDRREEGIAILLLGESTEALEQATLPASLLPAGIREGCYLRIAVSRDDAKTAAALEEAMGLQGESR